MTAAVATQQGPSEPIPLTVLTGFLGAGAPTGRIVRRSSTTLRCHSAESTASGSPVVQF